MNEMYKVGIPVGSSPNTSHSFFKKIQAARSLYLASVCYVVLGGYAFGFDGAQTQDSDQNALQAVSNFAQMSPKEAMRFGAKAYYSGDKESALKPLQYAAEQGVPMAAWKLGQMYAEGDGVQEDDGIAFGYFSQVAHQSGQANPDGQSAPFIANSLVELGTYYLKGIKGTEVVADRRRAKDLFAYAATYFGNADAQYELGMMYLEGEDKPRLRQAARWLKLAAQKGHLDAQGRFGELLFFQKDNPRLKVRGLFWLSLARRQVSDQEHAWLIKSHEQARALSNEAERAKAAKWADAWLQKKQVNVAVAD
ncbi:tetratricopeptide repeat protein [Flexibacterium corallicola]|uniref:tetratricopeptide repeat protein n=1 Tax=Flexibacterium corallicola TaxID=3037259 RepID=UPI00286F3A79|nr:tetratricopeptide repeat protein [Pseudovibrio sp. M1P-2-3]